MFFAFLSHYDGKTIRCHSCLTIRSRYSIRVGYELRLCYGLGCQIKILVLFDSQEELDAFGARLALILEEKKLDIGALEDLEVHCIISHRS